MTRFKVRSEFKMMGDQPQAVESISRGILEGKKHQTLMGVTGSGKTFTMANIIERVQKPTLVISHNKTLAAQLHGEFREFFPDNAVEYFVSYYDYYQPEAYVPSTDTYIEKDSDINDEIEKLRHSATAALFERRDVIIVASVSCIYGLGSPINYETQSLSMRPGMEKSREDILRRLVDMQYSRNDTDFQRGNFRVRGDVIDIYPAGGESAVKVELFGDEIESIREIDPLTGEVLGIRNHIWVFPASHYVSSPGELARAAEDIEEEMKERIVWFKDRGKLLEAQRIEQRTRYDIEMLREIGRCKGIENYSRHINGLPPGSRPYTLIDYFPEDFLIIMDESHAMLPQLRAMYAGDRSRKESLVDYGFRLPSALDNRPLKFEEFEALAGQTVYVSATPADYEREHSGGINAEQIIRPTALLDPVIEVHPARNQVDDLLEEISKVVDKQERVLVTTLTKRMAESLSGYLTRLGVRNKYIHSDVETLERVEIMQELRVGVFDVLIGVNLLREGLDLPEVSLVAILDADKEGFLRSDKALIQTIGRAARNTHSKAILYADVITASMQRAMDENARNRKKQMEYNERHHLSPKQVKRSLSTGMTMSRLKDEEFTGNISVENRFKQEALNTKDVHLLEVLMRKAVEELNFVEAAKYRDEIMKINNNNKKN